MHSFHTKIAGVKANNPDGENRQKVIAKCSRGEKLCLVREPDNPDDRRAVKVCRRSTGEQLGYLSRELGRDVSRRMRTRNVFQVDITNIAGGDGGRPYEVSIEIIETEGRRLFGRLFK